jgi:hypothetical protein
LDLREKIYKSKFTTVRIQINHSIFNLISARQYVSATRDINWLKNENGALLINKISNQT